MSDRDLLEAAARAAGYTIDKIHQAWRDSLEEGSAGLWLTDGTRCWNPLTDDGDALRLAVKLNLRVDCYDNQVETMDGCAPYKIGPETFTNTFVCIEPTDGGQGRLAATRRAIVRAAAALTQTEGGA